MKNPFSDRLKPDVVRGIYLESGLPYKQIAEKWNAPLKTVTAIRAGLRYRSVTADLKRGKNADRRDAFSDDRLAFALQRKCSASDLRRRIEAASQMKRDLDGAQIFNHPQFAELLPSG